MSVYQYIFIRNIVCSCSISQRNRWAHNETILFFLSGVCRCNNGFICVGQYFGNSLFKQKNIFCFDRIGIRITDPQCYLREEEIFNKSQSWYKIRNKSQRRQIVPQNRLGINGSPTDYLVVFQLLCEGYENSSTGNVKAGFRCIHDLSKEWVFEFPKQ